MSSPNITRNTNTLSMWQVLAVCASLAAATGLLHWMKVDKAASEDQIRWHMQILTNQGPYPDQYRILTYYLAHWLMLLKVPFARAHEWLRFLFTTASLYLFYRYLTHWFRPVIALFGVFIMAAALPLTFLFYFMQATDPLNTLIFFIAFWAFREGHDNWIIPIVVVGMFNRETAILIPLLYACVRFGQVPLRYWFPRFAIASAIAVLIYVGLRVVFGIKEPYASTSLLHYWKINLLDWKTWIQLLGFFNVMLWAAWRNWRHRPLFLRRAALILPLFFVIHFSVGYMREVRYFLPLLPILVPFTLFALEEMSRNTA